jgi:hypothetical protein
MSTILKQKIVEAEMMQPMAMLMMVIMTICTLMTIKKMIMLLKKIK